MRISTADFIEQLGELAEKAPNEPLTITKNGHDRLVVLSIDAYARLLRRDREVIRPSDLTPEELAALAAAEVPAEYAHLDAELEASRQ